MNLISTLFKQIAKYGITKAVSKTIKADPVAAGRAGVSTVLGLFGSGKQQTTYQQMPNPYTTNQELFNNLLGFQESAYTAQADLFERQADITLAESMTNAEIKARDAESFASQQALNYQSSGVTLEGSPMEVLNETRHKAKQEVQAILDQGKAYAELSRRQAVASRNTGRAAVLGAQYQMGAGQSVFSGDQAATRNPATYVPDRSIGRTFGELAQTIFGNN